MTIIVAFASGGMAVVSATTTSCSTAAATIKWDESTLVLIQSNAWYSRMIRLQTGEILCTYEESGKVWVRKSYNNGKSWIAPVLAGQYEYGVAANPELLQLRNGRVLLAYNERPTDGVHAFAIAVCDSGDGGKSWSPSRRIYSADIHPQNGCWEPVMIQLPSGEVQLFFANENPYRSSDEQEISMLRSYDNGNSWTGPVKISFRAGHRDGMPVPLVLRNKKGVVIAIEDNGICGEFKPAIIFMPRGAKGFVDGSSPRRWAALKTPLPADVCAAAPYICQFPSGETILSVQSTEGRPGNWWETSQMVVYIGDEDAKDFSDRTVPFNIPPNVSALFSAMFIKDANTVTAISRTKINGIGGIWAIDGHLVRSNAKQPVSVRSKYSRD